jgi:hypothetical protein
MGARTVDQGLAHSITCLLIRDETKPYLDPVQILEVLVRREGILELLP